MSWAKKSTSTGRDSEAVPPSDSLWVIEVNGVQEGPVKWSVIEELARVGALRITDSISPYEAVSWRKMGDLPGLAVMIGPAGKEACHSALVQKDEPDEGITKDGQLRGRASRIKTIVLLWLCLGFAWALMMLSDWPVIWDGTLIASLSVF